MNENTLFSTITDDGNICLFRLQYQVVQYVFQLPLFLKKTINYWKSCQKYETFSSAIALQVLHCPRS